MTVELLAKLGYFYVQDSVQHGCSICFRLLILSFVLGMSIMTICFVSCRVMEFTRMLNWGASLPSSLTISRYPALALGYARHPSLALDGKLAGNPAIGTFPWCGTVLAPPRSPPRPPPLTRLLRWATSRALVAFRRVLQIRSPLRGLLHSAAPLSPFGLLESIPQTPGYSLRSLPYGGADVWGWLRWAGGWLGDGFNAARFRFGGLLIFFD